MSKRKGRLPISTTETHTSRNWPIEKLESAKRNFIRKIGIMFGICLSIFIAGLLYNGLDWKKTTEVIGISLEYGFLVYLAGTILNTHYLVINSRTINVRLSVEQKIEFSTDYRGKFQSTILPEELSLSDGVLRFTKRIRMSHPPFSGLCVEDNEFSAKIESVYHSADDGVDDSTYFSWRAVCQRIFANEVIRISSDEELFLVAKEYRNKGWEHSIEQKHLERRSQGESQKNAA